MACRTSTQRRRRIFFAQGYVTAQDRLWQMDVLRRSANGELAELMGGSLVRHDTVQRVFQFRNTAQRVYTHLAEADRARLDAYARGVNLFIAQHSDGLPPEFALLHYRPKPWSGADSLSIGVAMMAQTLDDHWDSKLAREQIAARLHNPKLEADLYPVGSWRDHPPTGQVVDLTQPHPIPPSHDEDDDDDRTQTRSASHEDLRMLRALLGPAACADCIPGSNEWVIAGRHTTSGKPLLSNDMHLSLTVPNIWYMADLRAPGFHAAGVALAGVPFVVAGHNDHLAWGYTALYADVQDVYVEKLDGKGNYQAIDGSWKPLAVDHEVIYVRGGKDVALDVESTAHGPLMNPLFTRDAAPGVEVDALRCDAQYAADLPARHGSELRGCDGGPELVEFAYVERRLRRRPGTHCLSRSGPCSAPPSGTLRNADSRCNA